MLGQELSQAREEMENKSSELEKKDSELQAAFQGLEAANRLAGGFKAELNPRKAYSRARRMASCVSWSWRLLIRWRSRSKDVARLQKEVKVFKFLKYRDRYNDGAQGEPSRYPLGAGSLSTDQGTVEVLTSYAPSMPDVSAMTMVVRASRDSLASAVPAKGQSVEAC